MKCQILTLILLFIILYTHGQSDTVAIKDYDYYKTKFDRGTRLRNTGIGLNIGGAVLFGVSVPIINSMDFAKGMATGTVLIFSSFCIVSVGISMSCAGGAIRFNNRKAMKNLDRNLDLSIGSTPHGIGLTLRF